MQPNYEEMMKRQEQSYQRSRDPFEYGRQVAQRRYSEIMSDLDTRRQASQQSYGDLYSAARQRAVRGQAAGGPTLSGGMGQQQRDYISAIEMQELGRIGTAREGAQRDLFTQAQSAFSNAQLEGQQATQMEAQNRQLQLELQNQVFGILGDAKSYDKLDSAQLAQLSALGYSREQIEKFLETPQRIPGKVSPLLEPFLFPVRAGFQLGDKVLGQRVGTTEERFGIRPRQEE
jgi:hypothetical protein